MADLKNPYELSAEASVEVIPGRRSLWFFVVLFFAFLLLPWTWQLIRMTGLSPGASVGFVKEAETAVESLSFFEEGREADQSLALRFLNEGNRRVFPGDDGWLFYWPDLEAIIGKGPYYEQPVSVARERVTDSWTSPVEVVKQFASQLEERGITLVLVPVPTKAMLCPEKIGAGEKDAIIPPAYRRLLEDFSRDGIEVVDLVPEIASLPVENRFLKSDTHWTPEAMFASASLVARRVEATIAKGALDTSLDVIELSHKGDLAGMLGAEKVAALSGEQRVVLAKVRNGDSGAPISDDETSQIVLLGDSFVNIFDDPTLGFEGEERIGAGFASHFSAAMSRRVHTIAINGDGASGVRRAFASLPDDDVRSRKVVVWVFSARDLLLSELPARRAGIRWAPVEFRDAESTPSAARPSAESEPDLVTITATVSARTDLSDPRETPYANALYSVVLSDIVAEEGSFDEAEAFVYLWGFRNRLFEPTARIEAGKRYRFTIQPFAKAPGVSGATQVDDLFRIDLDPWFASRAELIEE